MTTTLNRIFIKNTLKASLNSGAFFVHSGPHALNRFAFLLDSSGFGINIIL
jgi:hypothetical protein